MGDTRAQCIIVLRPPVFRAGPIRASMSMTLARYRSAKIDCPKLGGHSCIQHMHGGRLYRLAAAPGAASLPALLATGQAREDDLVLWPLTMGKWWLIQQ